MSMDSMWVDYGQCNTVMDELTQADNKMQGLITDLQKNIKPLQQTWLGVSETEYEAVQGKWNTHMANMSALLVQYHVVLNEMVLNYNVNDMNIAAHWQAIP